MKKYSELTKQEQEILDAQIGRSHRPVGNYQTGIANMLADNDKHIAELKMILPSIDLRPVNVLIEFFRSIFVQLPVAYPGDGQIYEALKSRLLTGVSFEDSLIEVKKAIDTEYLVCRVRLNFGIRSFNVMNQII